MQKIILAAWIVLVACHSDEKRIPPKVSPVTNDLVRIPGGPFLGRAIFCDGTRYPSPPPKGDALEARVAVKLSLPDFEIDRNVVSCADMHACVEAGQCKESSACDGHAAIEYLVNAMEYCAWRGMHVVKYAEWQRAVRSADGRQHPSGVDWDPSLCPAETGACKLQSPDGVQYSIFDSPELTSDTECDDQGAKIVPLMIEASTNNLAIIVTYQSTGRFRCAR